MGFIGKYKHHTADEWENFLFGDDCSKYLFNLPNQKNDVVFGSQEIQVPPAYQFRGSAKCSNDLGWYDQSLLGVTAFSSLGANTDDRLLKKKILEKEVKPLLSKR